MNVESGLETEHVGARVVGNPPEGVNGDDVARRVAEEVESHAPGDRLRAIRFNSEAPVPIADGVSEIVVDATIGSSESQEGQPAPRAKVISAIVQITGGTLAVVLPFYLRRNVLQDARSH